MPTQEQVRRAIASTKLMTAFAMGKTGYVTIAAGESAKASMLGLTKQKYYRVYPEELKKYGSVEAVIEEKRRRQMGEEWYGLRGYTSPSAEAYEVAKRIRGTPEQVEKIISQVEPAEISISGNQVLFHPKGRTREERLASIAKAKRMIRSGQEVEFYGVGNITLQHIKEQGKLAREKEIERIGKESVEKGFESYIKSHPEEIEKFKKMGILKEPELEGFRVSPLTSGELSSRMKSIFSAKQYDEWIRSPVKQVRPIHFGGGGIKEYGEVVEVKGVDLVTPLFGQAYVKRLFKEERKPRGYGTLTESEKLYLTPPEKREDEWFALAYLPELLKGKRKRVVKKTRKEELEEALRAGESAAYIGSLVHDKKYREELRKQGFLPSPKSYEEMLQIASIQGKGLTPEQVEIMSKFEEFKYERELEKVRWETESPESYAATFKSVGEGALLVGGVLGSVGGVLTVSGRTLIREFGSWGAGGVLGQKASIETYKFTGSPELSMVAGIGTTGLVGGGLSMATSKVIREPIRFGKADIKTQIPAGAEYYYPKYKPSPAIKSEMPVITSIRTKGGATLYSGEAHQMIYLNKLAGTKASGGMYLTKAYEIGGKGLTGKYRQYLWRMPEKYETQWVSSISENIVERVPAKKGVLGRYRFEQVPKGRIKIIKDIQPSLSVIEKTDLQYRTFSRLGFSEVTKLSDDIITDIKSVSWGKGEIIGSPNKWISQQIVRGQVSELHKNVLESEIKTETWSKMYGERVEMEKMWGGKYKPLIDLRKKRTQRGIRLSSYIREKWESPKYKPRPQGRLWELYGQKQGQIPTYISEEIGRFGAMAEIRAMERSFRYGGMLRSILGIKQTPREIQYHKTKQMQLSRMRKRTIRSRLVDEVVGMKMPRMRGRNALIQIPKMRTGFMSFIGIKSTQKLIQTPKFKPITPKFISSPTPPPTNFIGKPPVFVFPPSITPLRTQKKGWGFSLDFLRKKKRVGGKLTDIEDYLSLVQKHERKMERKEWVGMLQFERLIQ